MDTDGDGEISFTEFITAAFNKKNLLTKENLDKAFKTFNTNGDGRISVEELQKVFVSGIASDETIEISKELLAPVDPNDDGKIDFEEFITMMVSIFQKKSGLSSSTFVK